MPLLLGGLGVNIFRAVYRDGAPIDTVAERRAALVGFAAGAFKIADLAKTALSAVSGANDVQLQINDRTVIGPKGELEDAAQAPLKIADRTWVLVVRDPEPPRRQPAAAAGRRRHLGRRPAGGADLRLEP